MKKALAIIISILTILTVVLNVFMFKFIEFEEMPGTIIKKAYGDLSLFDDAIVYPVDNDTVSYYKGRLVFRWYDYLFVSDKTVQELALDAKPVYFPGSPAITSYEFNGYTTFTRYIIDVYQNFVDDTISIYQYLDEMPKYDFLVSINYSLSSPDVDLGFNPNSPLWNLSRYAGIRLSLAFDDIYDTLDEVVIYQEYMKDNSPFLQHPKWVDYQDDFEFFDFISDWIYFILNKADFYLNYVTLWLRQYVKLIKL